VIELFHNLETKKINGLKPFKTARFIGGKFWFIFYS